MDEPASGQEGFLNYTGCFLSKILHVGKEDTAPSDHVVFVRLSRHFTLGCFLGFSVVEGTAIESDCIFK